MPLISRKATGGTGLPGAVLPAEGAESVRMERQTGVTQKGQHRHQRAGEQPCEETPLRMIYRMIISSGAGRTPAPASLPDDIGAARQ